MNPQALNRLRRQSVAAIPACWWDMGLNARDDKIGASAGPMAAEDARKYCRDREATIRASVFGIKREVTPLAMLFCLLFLQISPSILFQF